MTFLMKSWVAFNSVREYGAGVKALVDVASGRDPVLGRPETGVQEALRDG